MRPLTPFGLRVRQELMRRGLTVADLAREIGFNEKGVRDSLRGYIPGLKYRQKIEQYLGWSTKDEKEVAANE